MLLFKIAFRNVRRQIGGYLIYFFTVALTVSLLFSLAGLMFSKVVFAFSASFKLETALVCAFLALVLAVVSAWVLGYGCAFLLRRRKKEFGMYLTLGMKRSNIVAIFVCEMLFTFLFSLAAGLGLGMLVYQAIAAGVSAFLEADIVWADYTAGAFILTIVLVGAIFLITAAVSAGYLRFEKIANLLKGKNTKGKTVKRPHGWLVVSIISFVVFVVSVLVVAVTAPMFRFMNVFGAFHFVGGLGNPARIASFIRFVNMISVPKQACCSNCSSFHVAFFRSAEALRFISRFFHQ